eukprot:TRINITY_DN5044_c0_g1_i1.p1 TRINITY_DN5044_c0_g1~~TRINITY_DN5044_c0_g1_i1.p1  ORF type:complete len:479 (+),score=81.49 TRINITY_DN5044_c0_g1_i1:41-1477(+)
MGTADSLSDLDFLIHKLRQAGSKARAFYEKLRQAAAQGKVVPGGRKLTPEVVEQAISAFEKDSRPAPQGTAPPSNEGSNVSSTEAPAVPSAQEAPAAPSNEGSNVSSSEAPAVPSAQEAPAAPSKEVPNVSSSEAPAVPSAQEAPAAPSKEVHNVSSSEALAVPFAQEAPAAPSKEDSSAPSKGASDAPSSEIPAVSTPAASSSEAPAATKVSTDPSPQKGGRPFVVCSDNKVRIWKECSMQNKDDSNKAYLKPKEEFQAEVLSATGDGREWLRLLDGRGFACTTSSKDAEKVVLLPARKRSATMEGGTSASKLMNKALLIKKHWVDQIFDNGKVWEIRGERCTKRGRFCIAQSQSGLIMGEATMVDCLKVGKIRDGKLGPYSRSNKKYFIAKESNMPKHRITDMSIVTYPKVFAWVLRDAVRYNPPLPYEHVQGCVKWVTLPPELQQRADGAAGEHAESEDGKGSGSSSDSSDGEGS